jgi:hypothetical protein
MKISLIKVTKEGHGQLEVQHQTLNSTTVEDAKSMSVYSFKLMDLCGTGALPLLNIMAKHLRFGGGIVMQLS